jgi:hypothetical protein
MRIEPISCPETSVRNYRYWLPNNPEESLFYCLNVRWVRLYIGLFLVFISFIYLALNLFICL